MEALAISLETYLTIYSIGKMARLRLYFYLIKRKK